MSELENLASKSDADLIQIAVAFGDFTPEQAQSKTREELISAISGNTDAADRSALSTAEVPAPKKRGRKPKTVKPAEEKTAEEVIALTADKANDGDSDSSAMAPEVKIPKSAAENLRLRLTARKTQRSADSLTGLLTILRQRKPKFQKMRLMVLRKLLMQRA